MRRSATTVAALAVLVLPLAIAGCTQDDAADSNGSGTRSTTTAVTSTAPGTSAAETTVPAAPAGGPSTTVAPPRPSTSAGGAADPSVTVVLRRAVEEERHAEATYRNVIARLGDIRPFTQIAPSEAQHVAALERLASQYGVDVSDIRPTGEPSPATRGAACTLGVGAEQADIALYDELLPQVTAHPDVTTVLTALRAASADNHLPAFQRCAP